MTTMMRLRHATNRPARLGVSREDGFTMIELLVSIIFVGVLFAAFSMLISSTLARTSQITNESVLQTQVRNAVNELTADLRQAYPPSTTATSVFVPPSGGSMSSTTLTFYSPDRTYSSGTPTSFRLREITYQVSSGNFQRAFASSSNTDGPPWTIGSFGSWVTRVGGVTNTDIFTYYDSSNPPVATTDPTKVATVVVKLTVTTPQSNGRTFTYSDSATLRVNV